MTLTASSSKALGAVRRALTRATEPALLFPIIAALLLAVLWVTTIGLIRVQYAGARAAAMDSTRKLNETYEAQVVRALREIDQSLRLVQYAYELRGLESLLAELRSKTLLPPDFLFVVSIADARGNIVARTRPGAPASIAHRDYFERQVHSDSFTVGIPQQDPKSGEWTLTFSRRLNAQDGSFAGAVTVSVGAAYFVSGYEAQTLGQHGFLGLLGTDGVFRAYRSGDTVTSGTVVEYEDVLAAADGGASVDEEVTPVTLAASSWDGVRRYTAARELYEFPVAVVVGLAEDEALLGAAQSARRDIRRSGAASVALLALMAVLGRLSWQLQKSRHLAAQEQVAHAERVQHLAHHDSLTGLPNRAFFSHMLNHSLELAKRYNRPLALLFMDLDRFKLINDTLGHDVGDELLQEVARRLKEAVRASDFVARLGGDEFVVILPEQSDDDSVTTVARRVLASAGKMFTLNNQEFRVTISIGVSRYPKDAQDEQTLIKNADVAMYHAKEHGRNTFEFYSATLGESSLERLTLESALRGALERKEFRLYYQEQRDLKTGAATGMEALLRWEHPQLGIVLPMRFLPVAEEIGLIVPLGKWVIETACQDCVRRQRQGEPPLSVSINLSKRQFSDENLIRDLARILRETAIDPSLLELEITERVLMADFERAVVIINAIKALGVRLAIDNFGTSYSSLSTLQRFHFDTVKIDGTVIRDSADNPEARRLTEAIIAMGKNLALTVIAEGVETMEQEQFLRDNMCDRVQGFYFGPPAPLGGAGGT